MNRGSTALRVVVYAASVAAFAFPLGTTDSVVAAVVGAALGAVGGPWLARSTLRTPALAVGVASALVLSLWLARSNLTQDLIVNAWGPTAALGWSRHIQFFVASLWTAVGLAALSVRHRLFSILEAAFSAAAVASLVIGHRHGAINRPFEIADPIIASGGDPALAMLAVGVVAAALTVLVLLRERSAWRSLLHVLVVALLLLLVLETTSWLGLPQPTASGGLGLRADPKSDQQGQQRGPGVSR
jgi:hypothetical protein